MRREMASVDAGTPVSLAGVELVALVAASGLSLAAALMHLWTMPDHFAEWWGYGAFFLVVALAQGLYGVALMRWPSRKLFASGIAANLAIVSLFISAHTQGLPVGPHAGEVHPADALGITCTLAEILLILTLLGLARGFSVSGTYVFPAVLLAFGTGGVLHALHTGTHEAEGLSPLVHWASSSALSLPSALLVVWLAGYLAGAVYGVSGLRDGLSRGITWAFVVAAAYAVSGVLMNGLAMRHTTSGSYLTQVLGDAGAVLGTAFLILLAFAALLTLPWRRLMAASLWNPRAATVAAGLVAAVAVAGPVFLGGDLNSARAQQATPQCSAATADRTYSVAAINVDIPFNRWGRSDPNGQVFVLQGDKEAVRHWYRPLDDPAASEAQGRRLRPRPLVLRARVGECVRVNFANELQARGGDGLPNNPRASIKVFGPAYAAQSSDGSAVGFNRDTTVPNTPGRNRISYFWRVPDTEGTYVFRDQGATAGSEGDGGSTGHGLYGALVAEPAGSTWRDPETGRPLYAGTRNHTRITKHSGDPYVDADIVVPNGRSFRESLQVSQDELPGSNGFAFNYGAEPGFNRTPTNPAGNGIAGQAVPDGLGEETSLSSWAYGDPALVKLASGKGPWLPEADPNDPGGRISAEDCGLERRPGGSCYVSNVAHSYPGDPTKIRFLHAGIKETHVFHMHAHQWRSEPRDPRSNIIDSQTYGPGESFTADLIGGAGSKPGTFGDSIFHCHLYPHFADGFWALFRVHDVRENGSGRTPDGIKVRNLVPLPGRAAPPAPTANNPGFPRFIPGEFGWRAPQPPGGLLEPDPTTPDPNDRRPATRLVAGERIPADKLALEAGVQRRGGYTPRPGAPFVDPCPTGARQVTYNVSVIQTDVVYNERGDHDTQGRILVLDRDVEDVLAGRKDPEPLFFRVNAGDCVNFNLTNRLPNWFGADAFVRLAQTNMFGEHIHLVKFDVLGSDGSSNGWNYQQAAFTREQAEFNQRVLDNAPDPGESCNQNGCRVRDPANWDPTTRSGPGTVGQTIRERWYADTELRTVFTHDHHFPALDQNRGLFGALLVEPRGVDFRNPRTGQFFQPGNGSVAGAPRCGSSCEGTAAGTAMDVIGPGANDDFREFGLAVQDFVSLTRAGGNPRSAADTINPPETPEAFPDDDPGTMGINYRNAPFQLRQEKNGQPTDPAYTFSSTVHGDPRTPVMEAYAEDPVRVRLIQGSQEEQHVFTLHGMRWRDEPNNPDSPLVNSKAIGVSEAFNFQVPRLSCGPNDTTCVGDYLYSGTATDDLYLGAWGLLRARGARVPSLLPLPDNVPRARGGPLAQTNALAPPEANSPGNPCPPGVPVRKYNVVAFQKKLVYNKQGDNDPSGLVYALAGDERAIRDGTKKAGPLVLRANEGNCVEVRLTNKLTQGWLDGHPNAGTRGDPTLPTEPAGGTRSGLRVSLHPQLLKYDVRGSDGTAVGFNRDQTVGPGESRLYRWYADNVSPGEIGATNLTDFGDVRGHRHHGLFAGLTIEPRGATYHDPRTGRRISSGARADIRVPGAGNDFREFTTFFQDGLNLRDRSGAIIEDPLDHPPTPEEPNPGLDAEDQGEKAFNYANAPFQHRMGGVRPVSIPAPNGSVLARVFSSTARDPATGRPHGDPDTPIFRAFAGDRIRMRVLQGSDKPRQHSFQLSGHSWKLQPGDPRSERVGTQGGMSVGRALNLHLSGARTPGDYRYGCGVNFHHLSGGLWGIVRLYPRPEGRRALSPTPLANLDNPHAPNRPHPILPLEGRR